MLTIGAQVEVALETPKDAPAAAGAPPVTTTLGVSGTSIATVLVGDIRDYTLLVRRAPPAALQQSVNRVFETLNAAVTRHQGTVKEYQGDAVLAFWEGDFNGEQLLHIRI